jgi:hypothetical protein
MAGQKSHLSLLEWQKQLLIVESEINRVQLRQEWEMMTVGASSLVHQAKTLGSFTSASASLVASLGACWSNRSVSASAKPSGLETVFKGARLAYSLWLVLRRRS